MESVALVFVCLLSVSYGYSSGAPEAACGTLAPVHSGIVPQNSASPTPYSITANGTMWMDGGALTVMISGGDINGFILQAVSGADSKTPIGSFDADMLPSLTQTGPCMHNGGSVSVTHTSPDTKTNLKFIWKAPLKSDGPAGAIFFQAAVATDHDTYWSEIKSDDIMHVYTTTQTINGGDGDGDGDAGAAGSSDTEETTTPSSAVVALANAQLAIALVMVRLF